MPSDLGQLIAGVAQLETRELETSASRVSLLLVLTSLAFKVYPKVLLHYAEPAEPLFDSRIVCLEYHDHGDRAHII